MKYTTLISTIELAKHLNDPTWLLVDCRFALATPDSEEQSYQGGHIPGAVYAHLNRDLSDPVIPGVTGRHPLPTPEQAALTFARLGIGNSMQVVAYDDAGGTMAAGRLWWMLRWLGHDTVAVLDGGWKKWLVEGRPVTSGIETRRRSEFIPHPRPELLASTEQVEKLRLNPAYRILDARVHERYTGQNETIDPVAGHIPGAFSLPNTENLSPEGTFRPVEELRASFQARLGKIPAEKTVFYCGSGVAATQEVLAVQHAGFGEARLYAGSWSEWITDRSRPVATGENPG